MMTNKYKTTLYIGVTSNLRERVFQHRQHFYPDSFTSKYNLTYCIYYERFPTIMEAISREKELKKWRREKKNQLINATNPAWNDLWGEIQKKSPHPPHRAAIVIPKHSEGPPAKKSPLKR